MNGLVRFFSIDLLKLDIISIYDLSNKMVAVQNMLGTLMGLQFLRLSNGSSVVIVQQDKTINGARHSELTNELPQLYSFLRSIGCCDILYLI